MSSPRRSTAETVVLLLSATVFVVLVVMTVALALDEVVDPSPQNVRLINWITSVVDTILGALIGFVAGRAYRNGNGH